MSSRTIECLLMDLDGTLVDSAPDLTDAVNVMMQQLDLPTCTESQVRGWVGSGAARLVEHALTAVDGGWTARVRLDQANSAFFDAYRKRVCKRSRLYPGAAEALAWLKKGGFKLACVTNKPTDLSRSLLTGLGVIDYFSLIVGGDSIDVKKPDPGVLHYAAGRLDTPIEACMMVGDSTHDVEAARSAGIGVVCVSYGYNKGKDIREAEPDAVIDNLLELGPLLLAASEGVR